MRRDLSDVTLPTGTIARSLDLLSGTNYMLVKVNDTVMIVRFIGARDRSSKGTESSDGKGGEREEGRGGSSMTDGHRTTGGQCRVKGQIFG